MPWQVRSSSARCSRISNPERDLQSARVALAETLRIRNAGVTEQYLRLEIPRHYQAILLIIGGPLLIGAVALLAVSADHMANRGWAHTGGACLLAALLGALGAATSAGQRSTKTRSEDVPVQFGSNVVSIARIPIGAVAGLSVWLFSLATAVDSDVIAANMLLAAFGAGFAERLIVQGNAVAPEATTSGTTAKGTRGQ